jgi:hypothetical protein
MDLFKHTNSLPHRSFANLQESSFYEVRRPLTSQRILTDYIQNKDSESTRIKREPSVTEVETLRIKRERGDSVAVGGREKKRKTGRGREMEVIVIDD